VVQGSSVGEFFLSKLHILQKFSSMCSSRVSTQRLLFHCLDVLSSNQAKLVDELREFRQDTVMINNQLQDLNTRLHTGNIGCKRFCFLISNAS